MFFLITNKGFSTCVIHLLSWFYLHHIFVGSHQSSSHTNGWRYKCHGCSDMAPMLYIWFKIQARRTRGLVITITTKCCQRCHLDRFLSGRRLARLDSRRLAINFQLVSFTWGPLLSLTNWLRLVCPIVCAPDDDTIQMSLIILFEGTSFAGKLPYISSFAGLLLQVLSMREARATCICFLY